MSFSPFVIETIVAALAGFLSAFAAFSIIQRRRGAPDLTKSGETRMLFESGGLVDGSPGTAELLAQGGNHGDDLTRLGVALSPLFPDLPAALGADGPASCDLKSKAGDQDLHMLRQGSFVDVSLSASVTDGPGAAGRAALSAELELLRSNVEAAPFVAWREAPDGQVTWINRSYLDLAREIVGAERAGVWPLPVLFNTAVSPDGDRQRIAVTDSDVRWFHVRAAPAGGDILKTAMDVTDTVSAEERLREFMQTLTKTFASLKIGLAVFNRDRDLVLYNPALVDLTGLPVDLLTARPSLSSMLDMLRERQMMPEPRDYREWRDAIAHLEAAAEDGSYADTWNLPDDRTYRVTGRPHPGGAIALLFEDISAEMSLTRSFRAELDLGQAILDELDDAVAVFSTSGVLTMSNLAYGRLWGTRPDINLADITIMDATRTWAGKSLPTPIWGDLRDFVQQPTDRSDWSATVQLDDGRGLDCRVAPLSGGMTLVTFRASVVAHDRGDTVALPPMRRIG